MQTEYVYYCNQCYRREDLKVKNTCQFCGCEVDTSFLNLKDLPDWSMLNIKFGKYVREYCLCESCGKKVIEAIGKVEKETKHV